MRIEVKPQVDGRKSFGVFVNGELVEGGFFEREAALQAARALASELIFEEARGLNIKAILSSRST